MGVEHVQEEDDEYTYTESHWSTTVRIKEPSATSILEKPTSSIRHKKILTMSFNENMEQYTEFDFLNDMAPTPALTL